MAAFYPLIVFGSRFKQHLYISLVVCENAHLRRQVSSAWFGRSYGIDRNRVNISALKPCSKAVSSGSLDYKWSCTA